MPVSRPDFLEKVFHNLEMLECDRRNTNLLVIVDGDAKLFVDVRNRVEMSKFNQRLCVQYQSKVKKMQYDLKVRRNRISDIHNTFKKYMAGDFGAIDFVMGIEDDTLIPLDALKKLKQDYSIHPFAGFIEAVELGRWGIPYVGAWKVDDIYTPTKIESLMPSSGLTQVDAGGFYCFMTTIDNYMMHHYKPFGNNDLGPDMEFGIALRQQGLENYIDWSINCIHKSKEGDISLGNTQPRIVTFIKKDEQWRHFNAPTQPL